MGTDEKIELMKIAAKDSPDIETTIRNYEKLVTAIQKS